jgi:NDP-sugar pyrophosphorylase family protein
MKAVVLIGGFGTRMRPLTYTISKVLLPIVNRPFLERILRLLCMHGVSEIILSMNYMPDPIKEYVDQTAAKFPAKITSSIEPRPLGSGGALKFNGRYLDDTFLLLNGDILTNLDITSLIEFHRSKGAIITATLSEVDDPTHWGIVELDEDGRALCWQEKPSPEEARSRWGNVGVWVMEPDVLDEIPPGKMISIEKQIFPKLLTKNIPFYGYRFSGYWKDIGTPDKYLQAQRDVLLGQLPEQIEGDEVEPNVWIGFDVNISESATVIGPVVMGNRCFVGPGSKIVGPAVIGNGCQIAAECDVEDSVIWADVVLEEGVQVFGAVVGAHTCIRKGCKISMGTIISDNCSIGEFTSLLPNTAIGPGSTLPSFLAGRQSRNSRK